MEKEMEIIRKRERDGEIFVMCPKCESAGKITPLEGTEENPEVVYCPIHGEITVKELFGTTNAKLRCWAG